MKVTSTNMYVVNIIFFKMRMFEMLWLPSNSVVVLKICGISWLAQHTTKDPGKLIAIKDKGRRNGKHKREHGSECRQPQLQSRLTNLRGKYMLQCRARGEGDWCASNENWLLWGLRIVLNLESCNLQHWLPVSHQMYYIQVMCHWSKDSSWVNDSSHIWVFKSVSWIFEQQ